MCMSFSHLGWCKLTGSPEWVISTGGPRQPVSWLFCYDTSVLNIQPPEWPQSEEQEQGHRGILGQDCSELAHILLFTFLSLKTGSQGPNIILREAEKCPSVPRKRIWINLFSAKSLRLGRFFVTASRTTYPDQHRNWYCFFSITKN